MIAVDLWRISVVERQGFNRVISFLTGGKYTMRARSTFTNRLKKKFEQSKESLKKTLKEEQIISLTTDSWTSLKTDSYLTVTGHFIDNEWQFQQRVLKTEFLGDRHTEEIIAAHLKDIVEEYGIVAKVNAQLCSRPRQRCH